MKNTIKTEIIEKYMNENKLSKTKFCKMCKISPSTLNKIMTKNTLLDMYMGKDKCLNLTKQWAFYPLPKVRRISLITYSLKIEKRMSNARLRNSIQ